MAWSDLSVDLLHYISSHLPFADFLRFSTVCTFWNSSLANNNLPRIYRSPTPWLLLPNDEGVASGKLTFRDLTIEEGYDGYHRSFSSLSSHIFGRLFIGSKDGWLVTLDEIDPQPRLFNPLTKAEISLPSLFTIPKDQFRANPRYALDYSDEHIDMDVESIRDLVIDKIVLSSNNPLGTAVVMYGFKKLLTLAGPRDHTWVLGPQLPPYHDDKLDEFNDIYFHEEEQRFYAITFLSAVLSFDLNGQNVKLICPATQDTRTLNFDCRNYIAFLSGKLLKIERMIENIEKEIDINSAGKTTKISVFMFVSDVITYSCSPSQWISIKDLWGYSLFVGCNQTFSLHHMDAPEIKPNCIYFSDHWEDMSPSDVDRDAGLFDLHNDCFQYFLDSDSQPNWPPSIWFTPSLS